MNIFLEFAGCAAVVFASFGTGSLLLYKSKKCEVLMTFSCGMILNAAAAMIIPPYILRFLILIPAVYGIYCAVPAIKKEWKVSAVFLLLFSFLLGGMLLPPSAWDEQVYQIALLKKYLTDNSTAVIMSNPYSAYPSLGQLWVLPGFAIGGLCVPVLCIWAVNLFIAARFYILGRKWGKSAAVISLAAVLFSPLFWNIIRSFYVESVIVIFAFAGSCMLLKNSDGKEKNTALFLAGIAAGGAAAVKLTAIGVSGALAVMVLADRENRKYLKYFILGGMIAALPFYLRTALCCGGNPFYPYCSKLFNASVSACMTENFHHALGGNYGFSPFFGTFFNWITASYNGLYYDGITMGMQFILLFAAIAVGIPLKYKTDRKLLICGSALLTIWIFWNFTAQQTRFLYPFYWAAAFAALYLSSYLTVKIRQIAAIALCACCAVSLYLESRIVRHYHIAWKTFREARKNPAHFAAWRAGETACYEIARQLEKLRGKRIASLWDRRTLYLPGDVDIIMPGFQEKLTPVPGNKEELFRIIAEYDYLIIHLASSDVDKGIEFVPDAVRLNKMLLDLMRQGKLAIHEYTSDGQISILRIVPDETAAGTALASSTSRSASDDNPDASARSDAGNPRPLR